MSRPSPSKPTLRASLMQLALRFLAAAVAILRGRCERDLLRPFLHPDYRARITREKFLAMTEMLFRDEARLRREIFTAAMRMRGREVALADRDFVLPRPRTARGLCRRWADYARMVRHADWYAWRLARRLVRMERAAGRRDRPAPDHAALSAAVLHLPIAHETGASRAQARTPPRSRAPPRPLIPEHAPCKPPLARSRAFA